MNIKCNSLTVFNPPLISVGFKMPEEFTLHSASDYLAQFLIFFFSFQIKEEFRRITTISLEQTFMYTLDRHTAKLTTLMKAKGGVMGTKLRPFLDKLSQVCRAVPNL